MQLGLHVGLVTVGVEAVSDSVACFSDPFLPLGSLVILQLNMAWLVDVHGRPALLRMDRMGVGVGVRELPGRRGKKKYVHRNTTRILSSI